MRLRTHIAIANDELIELINEGYEILSSVELNYESLKKELTFVDTKHTDEIMNSMQIWEDKVEEALIRIFPTKLEANLFCDPEIPFHYRSGNANEANYQESRLIFRCLLRGLNKIRLQSLPEYTDLPLDARLYIEDIDSFRKVRDVNPAMVMDVVPKGYFDRSEDFVQTALERILSVPFHKKDWGGEVNDLYTANLLINGSRHGTAFLLKGNGLKKKTMEIRNCGANGDQLLRLCKSPAKVFVVQFVGQISESVISDIDGKVRHERSEGRECWYCIMDGQDTARLLKAYGELP